MHKETLTALKIRSSAVLQICEETLTALKIGSSAVLQICDFYKELLVTLVIIQDH